MKIISNSPMQTSHPRRFDIVGCPTAMLRRLFLSLRGARENGSGSVEGNWSRGGGTRRRGNEAGFALLSKIRRSGARKDVPLEIPRTTDLQAHVQMRTMTAMATTSDRFLQGRNANASTSHPLLSNAKHLINIIASPLAWSCRRQICHIWYHTSAVFNRGCRGCCNRAGWTWRCGRRSCG